MKESFEYSFEVLITMHTTPSGRTNSPLTTTFPTPMTLLVITSPTAPGTIPGKRIANSAGWKTPASESPSPTMPAVCASKRRSMKRTLQTNIAWGIAIYNADWGDE